MVIEKNNIYNINCMDGLPLIEDNSIDMVLTDIPYGEVNRAKESGLRKLKKGNADELTFSVGELLPELYRVCKGTIYIFCGIEQVSEIRSFFRKKDMVTRLGIYKKTNPSPMNCQYNYLSDIECCIYAKKSGATFNGKYRSCVWEFPCGSSKIHPTQKPLPLFEYLLIVSSKEGDTVLDVCMGSGTTAVACIKHNRNYIGFELNEKYYQDSIERINNEKKQLTIF